MSPMMHCRALVILLTLSLAFTLITVERPNIACAESTGSSEPVNVAGSELAYFSSTSYKQAYCSPGFYTDGMSINYNNWIFKHVEYDPVTNFSCTVLTKGNAVVFAFRGTIPPDGYQAMPEHDWGNTLGYMILHRYPDQYNSLCKFLDSYPMSTYLQYAYNDILDYDIYFTGHSLGGWEALMAYEYILTKYPEKAEKIKRVVTFNALGLEEKKTSNINRAGKDKVINVYAGDDIARWASLGSSLSFPGISTMLIQPTSYIYAYDDAFDWLEELVNDSWLNVENEFVKAINKQGKDGELFRPIIRVLISIVRENPNKDWGGHWTALGQAGEYGAFISRLLDGHAMEQFLGMEIPGTGEANSTKDKPASENIFGRFVDGFNNILNDIWIWIENAIQDVKDSIVNLWDSVKIGFQNFIQDSLKGLWDSFINYLKDLIERLIDYILTFLNEVFG